jgi:hypothetical protein
MVPSECGCIGTHDAVGYSPASCKKAGVFLAPRDRPAAFRDRGRERNVRVS